MLKNAIIAGALIMTTASFAQEQPKFAHERKRENIEWTTTYVYNATDTKLPRVLLVGDSICGGYQQFVREELAGKVNVGFCATSKCVTDPTYLKQLAFILDEGNYDVVHFNNGLHSLTTDLKDWETGLRAAIKLIKEKKPDAKIIWCSSTPLNDVKKTERSKLLNEIAAKVMAEEGVTRTDDLFALMDPLDRKTNWTDPYHFQEPARKMQAKAVADSVRQTLGVGKASEAEAKASMKSTATGPNGALK